jgi:hypothetical protein
MTRHFARKFQTLSVVAMFVACIGALTVVAAPAIAQNPVPFVDQPLVPDATAPGGAGFTLTVNGAGFVSASVVDWNGSPRATTFVSRSKLTAAILASDIATASSAAVTVVNPSPGGGVSNTLYFSIAVAEAGVSFLPPVTYETGGIYSYSIAVADLNGDGKLDLVVANNNWLVGVLLGSGDGKFQSAVGYDSGGWQPASIAVADLNGDGIPDLVVADSNSDTVGVLLGNGDGTFRPAVTYGSGGGGPWSVVVADVNGDGKLDILVANHSSCHACTDEGLVGVLLGNGDGTFQPAVTYGSGGYYAYSVAVSDLNGDGKLDLAVTNACGADDNCSGNGSVAVLLGNGDGTFQAAVNYGPGGQGPNFGSLAIADVNGDGKPDLLVANENCPNSATCGLGAVGVLLGNGDGTFQPAVSYGSGAYRAISVAVADVNGDGKADLVVTNLCFYSGSDCPYYETGIVGVLLGNGDGTFQSAQISNSGGKGATGVAAADVNGDGRPDLLVVNLAGSVGVLLNNSGPHTPTTTALTSSENPVHPKQRVTYAATVASQSGTATGTVTFQDLFGRIATVALSNNEAACSTSYRTIGVHSVTATYSGDLNNAGSTSPALTEDIDGATKTVVTTSGSPSFVGQPVTFTATVTSVYGAIPNGDLVTFYDGTTVIGTRTTAGGVATYTTSSLTVTTHFIKATYAGDATFLPSSGTVTQVVNKYTTTTALVSSLNPSNYGLAVTLTATVTPTGPYQPTGTVTFKNGSVILGGVALNASGVATLTTAKIPVGADTLTATYNGNAFNGKSVSPAITQTVRQASISMVLTSDPNPSTFGTSVKFTAKLTSKGGLPSGQPVTFSYNGATLGTANVNSIGVATFYTTALPRGSDLVTAAYAGTVDYSAASATVTQVVN